MDDILNSLCLFSFIKENDDYKLLTCRNPIKLNYNWSYEENKKINYDEEIIHSSISVSSLKELTFLMKIKINDSEKIQLFKQGLKNLDGVIDAYIENSVLKIKIYYNFRNRTSIKLQKIDVQLPEDFKNDFHTLCIAISSRNFVVNVFEDNTKLDTIPIDFNNALDNSLNVAYNENNDTNHLMINNKDIEIKYFGVFSNVLTPLTYSNYVLE